MHLATAALEGLVILFMMMAVGWFLRARGLVTAAAHPALSVISLDLALPCLVFAVIVGRFHPAETAGWYYLPLWWAGFTAVALPLSVAGGWAVPQSVRREFRACLFYQNAMFFPLGILTEMFGGNSREVALLFLMAFLYPAFLFNTHSAFFHGSLRMHWRRTLHPVLLVTVVALGICLAGVQQQVPGMVVKAAGQIGALAVPLLMILLGARVRQDYENRGHVHLRPMLAFVAIRNVGFPLLFLAAVPFLNLHHDIGLLLLLQSAMPPVTAAPLLIERDGGNGSFASQLLLASYAASAVTIPLALLAYGIVAR